MAVQPYKRRGGAELEFELSEGSAPLVVAGRSSRRRGAGGAARPKRPVVAPFASVTMQSGSGSHGAQAVPAFVVASAVESPKLNLEGVPQWRITAGNLAAGATAGCAVEAGEAAEWAVVGMWAAIRACWHRDAAQRDSGVVGQGQQVGQWVSASWGIECSVRACKWPGAPGDEAHIIPHGCCA